MQGLVTLRRNESFRGWERIRGGRSFIIFLNRVDAWPSGHLIKGAHNRDIEVIQRSAGKVGCLATIKGHTVGPRLNPLGYYFAKDILGWGGLICSSHKIQSGA